MILRAGPLAVGVMGALALPRTTGAQEVAAAFPITLSVTPNPVAPGTAVSLSGTTALAGPGGTVTIKITGPAGTPPTNLSLKPNPAGDYQGTFTPAAVGTYSLTATAPDGKGTATATLTVGPPAGIADQLADRAAALATEAVQAVAAVRQGIAAMQPSPAKDQSLQRLAEVEAKVAQAPAQIATFRQHLKQAFEARAKVSKPIPEWNSYQSELATWQQKAEAARLELSRRAIPTEAGTAGCADLDRYNEMLTLTSEAFNYLKAPFDLSRGYFTDKIPGGLVARSGADGLTAGERFALIESMKIAAAGMEGPAGLIGSVPGLLLDTAQFILQQGFDQYCVKWEGPLNGTFVGESFTKAGEPFFDYTIGLEGKITLMYAKAALPSQPIKVSGYLEGSARFSIRDNPKPVARLVPGQVLFHRVTAPPGGGYWDEVGQASRSILPYGFRSQISGILAGDSISLQVGQPVHDFGPAIKGLSVWVILPAGGMVPQIIASPIELQKAHPILERVIRRRPILKIVPTGKALIVQGAFSRDTTNAGKTARVRTTLTIRACNPGCVPPPLNPAGKKP